MPRRPALTSPSSWGLSPGCGPSRPGPRLLRPCWACSAYAAVLSRWTRIPEAHAYLCSPPAGPQRATKAGLRRLTRGGRAEAAGEAVEAGRRQSRWRPRYRPGDGAAVLGARPGPWNEAGDPDSWTREGRGGPPWTGCGRTCRGDGRTWGLAQFPKMGSTLEAQVGPGCRGDHRFGLGRVGSTVPLGPRR